MSRPVVEFLKEYAEAAEDLAEEAKMRAEAVEKVMLAEEELRERKVLHREYADSVLGQLKRHLDNTYVVDERGNRRRLKKKGE